MEIHSDIIYGYVGTDQWSIFVPDIVSKFVKNFDLGKYPQLIVNVKDAD